MNKASQRVKIGFFMLIAGILLGRLGSIFSINHWLIEATSFTLAALGFLTMIFKKGEHFEGFIRKSPQIKQKQPKEVSQSVPKSPMKFRTKLFFIITVSIFAGLFLLNLARTVPAELERERVKNTTTFTFITINGEDKSFIAPDISDLQKIDEESGKCFYIYKGKIPRGISYIHTTREEIIKLLKPPIWYLKDEEETRQYFVNLLFTKQREYYWENDTLTIRIRPDEGRFWIWRDIIYVDFIYKWPPCTEEE
jgi:hypothetical protein